MLDRIKNNLLYKCLQVMMIAYFSISGSNISNSFAETLDIGTRTHFFKGMACDVLKKILKCDGTIEELEDYTQKGKTAKPVKGIPLLDYLIPSDASWSGICFLRESTAKNYMSNAISFFGFHGKIQVPPPRIVV